MGTITSASTLFPHELSLEMFNKVKGHSSLAKLSQSEGVPFSGTDIFVFSMDGEAAIVGEGDEKPANEADWSPVSMVPIKVVYQHRVTSEFMKMSNEKRLPYLNAFSDGFAKKIARAFDICAIHGVNPKTNTESTIIGNNCFDKSVTATVTYNASTPDDNIDSAVSPIQAAENDVTGIIMSPAFGSALGSKKMTDSGAPMYPEFRFGANPGSFGGMKADINSTVSFGSSLDRAIVGDFANAFRWGYAEDVTFEIIEFGDPDGQGDLKRKNQVCFRSEAFIGWAILDASSFARIVATNPLTSLTVAAEDGETDIFGTQVSDLQTGVTVANGAITGTLKYYSDSTKALVQDWGAGNFLAVKFSNIDADATSVLVGLEPSEGGGLVELIDDPDKNGVFKITDKSTQKFKVIQSCTGRDGSTYTTVQTYSLSGLTCETS